MSPRAATVDETRRVFGLAVCERLGLDPAIVSDNISATTTGDDLSPITLTIYLPTTEVIAMMLAAGARPVVTP